MQIKKLFFALVILATAAGCNNVDFKKTKGGMPYKLFTSGKGEKLQRGQIMKVQFTQKLNDSVLVTTYPTGPKYVPVPEQSFPYDISEVFKEMRKGDSVYAVQMVDTFIKQNPDRVPPQFKKGMKIITTVKVLDVFKNQEAAQEDEAIQRENNFKNDKKLQSQLKNEVAVISDYISKNNIQASKTANGTFVQITAPGNGPKVEKGKYVTLKYKGLTFAGKVFDTNMDTSYKHTEPLGFYVGKGQMLRGFDEGVAMLRKGDKAKLYIPSVLAYGAQPPSAAIGANENLIFEVEVLDVMDKSPEAGPFGGESPH